MEILTPLIVGESAEDIFTGKVVIGTVKGDVHNIGKNLVSLMMESTGFQVIDMGEDVTVDKFIEVVGAEKPDILGLSALLTTTMDEMKVIVDALKENNLKDSVKVMIGGAPVTKEFAEAIGADGYAPDAGMAASKAKELMGL
jgi:5-methyltetrahydrofolate--homocysteine methyltransferase